MRITQLFYKNKSNEFLDALKDASTENNSADKIETGTRPKNYSCNCCNKNFKRLADFSLHMKNEHENENISMELTHQYKSI